MGYSVKNKKIIASHILFWLSYMVLGALMDFGRNPKHFSINILDMFFTHFPNMVVFYACFFAYTRFLHPTRALYLSLSLLIIYGLAIGLWLSNKFIIAPLIHPNKIGSSAAPFATFRFCIEVFWLFLMYAFFSFGYYYMRKSIRFERKQRLIEKEKHEAEYAFLRSQINPHFLNNTLNFFYAKSIPLSEELSEGIMLLSEIMRYSLEIEKDDKTTLISREIEHIKNVIKINQLRFNNKLQIEFKVNGPTDQVRIIPLILITVVENILKHGNCTDAANPAKVILNIGEDGSISLNTFNTRKKAPKELSSGIGMDNIKKRLLHFYEKGFSLDIHDTEVDYAITLKIEQPATASRFENTIYTKNHPIINRNENFTPPYPIV
ncbi:sensor histidine kinase [Pedobacter rhodius]|uniref:Sensor histidine kinase n=1 Tax=Pedobacter rhodius TaxID=3004098 RepID=A0ABT4L304_9SPHI|nr:sensor histidine kinase [Pedobacter sp. SJ11]MCZ4224443.1 sensor histidine kinase [Pedobacter sp. SJ11]